MADHLKLPEPRKVPSRRSRTGGGTNVKHVPGTHGKKLENELTAAVAAQRPVRTEEGVDPALVFKLRTNGGVSNEAKLEEAELQWLGNSEDWTYFVLAENGTSAFEEMLDAYIAGGEVRDDARDLTFFEGIAGIEPYGRDDRSGTGIGEFDLASDEAIDVDVILWPSQDLETARSRLTEVRKVFESTEATELFVDERPRFTILRARCPGPAVDALLDLGVVEVLRRPATPLIEPTEWRGATVEELPRPELREVAPIGLIDEEVMEHPLLEPSIASRRRIPSEHEWAPPGDHGTLVGGLLVLGDIESAHAGMDDWVAVYPVHAVRVLEPHPDLPGATRFPGSEPEVSVIEEAVRTLHAEEGVRVFNISITDPSAFDGPHLSLWSERMDELARELDVLFVIAVGNQRPELQEGEDMLGAYPDALLAPAARVAEPGAAANVLTVGAVARSAAPQRLSGEVRLGDRAIAPVGEPSPFTRSGPGVSGAIKPDVSHFGGNWVLNDSDILVEADFGVSVLSTRAGNGRLFGIANGTSYAAPRVTRLAAEVLARYPGSSANLLRTLIGAASRPLAVPASFEKKDRRRVSGNGFVAEADALDSGRNRVALMYEGEIEPDTTMIHPLPLPDDFVEASAERFITIALAFDPEVRRTRREYLTATMKVDLVRDISDEEIEAVFKEQPVKGDPAYRTLPNSDKLRLPLEPGTNECDDATLQVRRYRRKYPVEVSEHGYNVVLRHVTATWAERMDPQRYALVVLLTDEERPDVDLRASVEALLEVRERIRLRPRG